MAPTESLEMSIELPVKPEIVFRAWLDSTQHRDFTGGDAVIDPRHGGKFSAWDDYITGILLKIEPYNRITQSWRTSEFPPDAPASHLELIFEPIESGMRLTLRHTEIPAGQAKQYQDGWREYYFIPMLGYFSRLASDRSPNESS